MLESRVSLCPCPRPSTGLLQWRRAIVPFPRASAAEAPITAPFVPPGAFLEANPPQRRVHDCASCTISCVERGPRGRVVCNKASKKRAKAACRQPRRPIATPPLALRCAPDSGFYRARVRRSARETFKGDVRTRGTLTRRDSTKVTKPCRRSATKRPPPSASSLPQTPNPAIDQSPP